uniref:Hepcidin n=1 Tax=Clarias gariepinus TaxID=13013 RepID=A0A411DXQ9_CLAGA|nr:hepcidin [Clarias gariepinus]
MKPMSIVCAVIVIIACICISQSTAVPFSEVRLEERVETQAAQSLDQSETASLAKETGPEVLFRAKRQSHLSMCRYCCNCCKNKGCGYCCRF